MEHEHDDLGLHVHEDEDEFDLYIRNQTDAVKAIRQQITDTIPSIEPGVFPFPYPQPEDYPMLRWLHSEAIAFLAEGMDISNVLMWCLAHGWYEGALSMADLHGKLTDS